MKELRTTEQWADDIRRAAAILYDAGAKAVWLFGSRALARRADRLTDFDIAVEGFPHGLIAISRASRELHGKVDIVPFELADPVLRCQIAKSRILVPRVPYSKTAPLSSRPLPDSLAKVRTRAVAQLIRSVSPRSFIDFGCGDGRLLSDLAGDDPLERLTGVDFDSKSIGEARRLLVNRFSNRGISKVTLLEGIVTYRDPRFLGYDAAAAVEVVEHLDPPQLNAFAGVMFGHVRPTRAVITTPNADYNAVWYTRRRNGRRHSDHRFEWSRQEFAEWSNRIGFIHAYKVSIGSIGTVHPTWGPPTQVAVFDRVDKL